MMFPQLMLPRHKKNPHLDLDWGWQRVWPLCMRVGGVQNGWQPFNWSLTTWLGVYDLVYAIVIDWPVETRRLYETAVLEHFHSHLIKNGVTNYSWQQLYAEYRLIVPMCVYIATEYCRGGVNQRWIRYWLPMLKKILTAVDDLDCSALW